MATGEGQAPALARASVVGVKHSSMGPAGPALAVRTPPPAAYSLTASRYRMSAQCFSAIRVHVQRESVSDLTPHSGRHKGLGNCISISLTYLLSVLAIADQSLCHVLQRSSITRSSMEQQQGPALKH